jgi:hypothetical protein
MFLFEHSPFEASRMKIVFPSLHPLIDIYTHNAKLTCTYCGERFCVKMERSDRHKNERSSMCQSAASCYAFNFAVTSISNFIASSSKPATNIVAAGLALARYFLNTGQQGSKSSLFG